MAMQTRGRSVPIEHRDRQSRYGDHYIRTCRPGEFVVGYAIRQLDETSSKARTRRGGVQATVFPVYDCIFHLVRPGRCVRPPLKRYCGLRLQPIPDLPQEEGARFRMEQAHRYF